MSEDFPEMTPAQRQAEHRTHHVRDQASIRSRVNTSRHSVSSEETGRVQSIERNFEPAERLQIQVAPSKAELSAKIGLQRIRDSALEILLAKS